MGKDMKLEAVRDTEEQAEGASLAESGLTLDEIIAEVRAYGSGPEGEAPLSSFDMAELPSLPAPLDL